MPSFRRDEAVIHYEESGRGFPVLTFAPTGLQSTIEVWGQPSAPINPITELAPPFRVIAMDQRNAGGRSRGDRVRVRVPRRRCWTRSTEELARLLPNCELVPEWKTGAALTAVRARVKEFLSKHTSPA